MINYSLKKPQCKRKKQTKVNNESKEFQRLNSLLSEQQSAQGDYIKKMASGTSKWCVEESVGDVNKLYDELLSNQSLELLPKFDKSPNRAEKSNKNSIMIEHLDSDNEETKHEMSVSESINAEIDQMLLQSVNNFSSPAIYATEKHITKNKLEDAMYMPTQKKSTHIFRGESNGSDLERLASMILNENSKSKNKRPPSKMLPGKSSFCVNKTEVNNFESEANIIYEENITNQPSEKVFKKRQLAAQYMPYGIFKKQAGGLGKSNNKLYVKSNLLFYSKYDKRLTAEIKSSVNLNKSNAGIRDIKEVIIVGELKDKLLVCPVSEDVVQKNSVDLELYPIGNLGILFILIIYYRC